MERLLVISAGKIEPRETQEEALQREIWEELETYIVVERLIQTVKWDYPNFHLTMHCYWCHIKRDYLTLKEHKAAYWLKKNELNEVQWLPTDREVVKMIAL